MSLAHVLLPELLELLLDRLAGDLLVAAVGRVPDVHQGALGSDSMAKYWPIISFLLYIPLLRQGFKNSSKLYLPGDRMKVTVRLENCFLRVPLMYQICCLVPCCRGKLGELTKTAYKAYCTVHFAS